MIDRIRQDIQDRLDQLLTEADRLRQALNALGDGTDTTPARSSRSDGASRSRSRSRAGSATQSGSRSRSGSSRGSRSRGGGGSRAGSGGTKSAVLQALADADGEALTASEVASATGLGRASVSTTLSKLARAGDVIKAQRGYQLSDGSDGGGRAVETAGAEA